RSCRQALELATRVGDPHYAGICLMTLADIEFVSGNLGEIDTILESASATSDTVVQMVRAARGRLDLAQGRVGEGLAVLEALEWERTEPLGLNAATSPTLRAQQLVAEYALLAGQAAAARARLEPLLDRTEQPASD